MPQDPNFGSNGGREHFGPRLLLGVLGTRAGRKPCGGRGGVTTSVFVLNTVSRVSIS